MNFIYKLNIYKDETDKMEKNYKRGIEVLHRKMIFDMQRIFKYSYVCYITISHSESPTTERPHLTYEYLPTYDMRFVLFNRLSVVEGLHDIGENRR